MLSSLKKQALNILSPTRHITRLVEARTQRVVRTGPFAGMSYIGESVGSSYLPKLLGIYERELHSAIDGAISREPSLVVDVGAAEGYYAVELARRLPNVRVVPFEASLRGRACIEQLASLNGVSEQIENLGYCDQQSLASALTGSSNPFVIMDVEGFEADLLDPTPVQGLKRAEILIEMHDFIVPQVTELAVSRLSSTHEIDRIEQADRNVGELPYSSLYLRALPKRYREWAVDESRPSRMHWLHCVPKAIDEATLT